MWSAILIIRKKKTPHILIIARAGAYCIMFVDDTEVEGKMSKICHTDRSKGKIGYRYLLWLINKMRYMGQ